MDKFTKLLIGMTTFVILFYNQEPALNLSLFALVIWVLLFFSSKNKFTQRKTLLLSLSVFLSCFSFAWYGDPLSLFAVLFSLFTFGIYSQYPKIRMVLYPLLLLLNMVTTPFRFFYFKHWLPSVNLKESGGKFIALGIIPAIFFLIFFSIYTTGSDLFSNFISSFSMSFHIFQLIFLICLSFFILFNLWFLYIPKFFIEINQNSRDEFSEMQRTNRAPTLPFLSIDNERKSGEITLILLNLLLLIFVISYNYEQFYTLKSAESLSDETHERVITVITSIIFAISLILLYFKSNFNFDTKARLLKKLAYAWMILNALLVISAIIKNAEYVSQFGLTFKRISVYIFLLLCLTGLYFTYMKIRRRKTNAYLANKMAWTFFITIILTAPVNFSLMVTQYNVGFNKNTDAAYLKSLNYNKQFLHDHFKNHPHWKEFFENQKSFISREKNRPLLSSNLYYKFLNTNDK